jgi:hypothetical protein
MSTNRSRIDLPLLLFKVSVCILLFIIGGVCAQKDFPPFKWLSTGYKELYDAYEQATRQRWELLKPRRYKGDGVVVYDKSQAYPGFTVMQGLFQGGAQVRMVDMDGTLVHKWDINFFDIWPDPTHIYPPNRIPKTRFDFHTQGMTILKDGSIIVSVGNLGTAKLDKCSKRVWTVDRMTHHCVTPAVGGGYWIAGNRNIKNIPDKLLLGDVTKEFLKDEALGRYENILILVDENGQVIKEFSVLQALVDGGFEHQLYDAFKIKKSDPTHVNDIVIVNDALASKATGINPGDLLVSVRQMHMLAVFDQATGKIKWHHTGPWVRQHDPDIMPDGNIVVYNNGRIGFSFNRIPGSNLIELNPSSGKTRIIYPRDGMPSFYTDIMGNHQLLPNGNRLVTESRAGRIFEITGKGQIVWAYVEAFDNTHAALIEFAERYGSEYFDVKNWDCERVDDLG